MALYIPSDNYKARISHIIGNFRTWGGNNDLHIGEINMALGQNATHRYSQGELDQFKSAMDFGMKRMSKEGIHFSAWAGGPWWGSYNLLVTDGSTNTQLNDIYLPYYTRNGLFGGINWSGAEFDSVGTIESPNLATQATYPTQAHMNHLAAQGMKVIRFCIKWERIQTAINGPLRESEAGNLDNAFNRAATAGMKIMIDIHNYSRLNTNAGQRFLTDASLRSAWHDMLRRLLDRYGSHAAFHSLDIMNEPVGGSGGNYVAPNLWQQYSQECLTQLRNWGYNHKIMIPLARWSGLQEINTSHPGGPWITDPANNFIYEGHYYPDHTNSNQGTFANTTYSGEVNAASGFNGLGSFEWDGTTSGSFGDAGTPTNSTRPAAITGFQPNQVSERNSFLDGFDPNAVMVNSTRNSFISGIQTGGSGEFVRGNTSSVHSSGYVNSQTLSHTVADDSNILILHVGGRSATQDAITGITYNGVSMTKAADNYSANTGVSQWYLVNPATGVNNIVLSFTTTPDPVYRLVTMFAVDYEGVDEDDPVFGTATPIEVYSTTVSATVNSAPEGSLVMATTGLKSDYAITHDGDQTELYDSGHSDSNLGQLGVGERIRTSTGNNTSTSTWSTSDNAFILSVVYNVGAGSESVAGTDRLSYVHGTADASSERGSFLNGFGGASDDRGGRIIGIDTLATEKLCMISGEAPVGEEYSERGSSIFGTEGATSERGGRIIGQPEDFGYSARHSGIIGGFPNWSDRRRSTSGGWRDRVN